MIASPQRSKTESMNAPSFETRPVARARVPSNMSKTPPTMTTIPATSQSWSPARMAATTVIPKPIRVSPFGVSPSRPKKRAIGSPILLTRVRVSGVEQGAAAGPAGPGHLTAPSPSAEPAG